MPWAFAGSSGEGDCLLKVKHRKRNPSAEMVSALALVSANPMRRLAELDDFHNPAATRKRAAV